jgi:hypothetical protein
MVAYQMLRLNRDSLFTTNNSSICFFFVTVLYLAGSLSGVSVIHLCGFCIEESFSGTANP